MGRAGRGGAVKAFPSPRALRRLWPLIRPYRGRLLLATGCLIASAAVGLAFPQIVRGLLDAAFVRHDGALLDRIALLLIGLFTLQAASNFAQTYLLSSTGERVVARLREDLFRHLLRLSPGFFAERRTGELVSRLAADIGTVQGLVSYQLSEFARQTLYLVGGITLLTLTNRALTLTAVVVVPFVAGSAVFFGRRLRRISTGVQDKVAEATAVAEEAFSQIRTVQSFVQEAWEAARYGRRMAEVVQVAIRRSVVRGVFFAVITFATFGGMAVVLWEGGRLVLGGALGRREDDAREPAAPVLGRHSRPDHAGRRGHPRPAARRAAARDRHRAAGADAVLGQRAREHRLRATRRGPGGGRGGGAGGARPRVHRAAAAGLRDAGGRAGREALRGPAAAHSDRARAAQGPARADSRRGHLERGRGERAVDRGGAGTPARGPEHVDHRAPALDGAAGGPAGRARPRAGGRGGRARRAARPGRAVRTAVPAAVPGRGSPGDAVTSEARERLPRASALRDRGCLRSRDRHEDVLRLGPGELLDHEVMRSHRIHEVPGRLGLRRRRSVAAILEARGPEISCRAV